MVDMIVVTTIVDVPTMITAEAVTTNAQNHCRPIDVGQTNLYVTGTVITLCCKLQLVQLCIQPVLRQEFGMRTLLYDVSSIHHVDCVCMLNG